MPLLCYDDVASHWFCAWLHVLGPSNTSRQFPRVVAISTFQKRLHGGPKQRKTSRKIWPFWSPAFMVEWCPCLHDLVSSELKQRTFLHDGDATARKTLVRGCSFSRQNVSKQTRHTDKEVKDLLQNWILWNTSSFKAVRKLLPVAHESKIIMLKNSLLYLNNFPYNSYKRLQLEKIQVPLS